LILQHTEQLALRINRHLGNFVQEQRAALGLAEQPFAVGMGAGERALDGAEQFALDEFAGQRGAIDLDDAALAAGTHGVREIGDDFLARAALAADQDGDIAGGDAFHRADDLLHFGTDEHGRRVAAHDFERAAQGHVFLFLLFALERAAHVGQEFFRLERLGQKRERAETPRLERHLHRAHAREHEHLGVRPAFLDQRQQFQPRRVAQLLIQHHDIRLRHVGEGFLQRGPALRLGHLEFTLQHGGDQVADVRFVINK
jgi:hypothetical protein